ncbi:MAG: acyltransferase family protein [Planctomycetaceae bacterium]|nr:acyltransferase family protein [Planctomycetaceae bacterium]
MSPVSVFLEPVTSRLSVPDGVSGRPASMGNPDLQTLNEDKACTGREVTAAAVNPQHERIAWIDVLKGLTIVLVVLSHTAIDEVEDEVLYLFHMPLFFWLSGMMYRQEKYPRLDGLISKRARSLVIPYLWFALISYILWYFVARHFGRDAGANINPWLPVLGTFYGVANEPWLTHNTPLWFLPCLFAVEVLYWTLRRYLPSMPGLVSGLLLCSAVGYWLSLHGLARLPWGADVALTAVIFYGAGNLSWPAMQIYSGLSKRRQAWTNAGVLVLGSAAMWWGFGFVNMSENTLGPGYARFYTAALGGIAACLIVSQQVPPHRFLTWLGRNTLVILALQIPCYGLVKAIQQYGFGVDVEATGGSLVWGVIHTVAIVGLLIPVIWVIDRWAPFLKGQRRTDLAAPALSV